jgi:hypothetical protein
VVRVSEMTPEEPGIQWSMADAVTEFGREVEEPLESDGQSVSVVLTNARTFPISLACCLQRIALGGPP